MTWPYRKHCCGQAECGRGSADVESVCDTLQDHGLIRLCLMTASAAARPKHFDRQRPLLGAETKVQRQIVMSAAASAGLDLPGESFAASLHHNLGADGGAIAFAAAFQADFQI